MTIAEYLKTYGMDEQQFADQSGGLFSAEAVRKWRFGVRHPRPEALRKIAEITEGQVTPNDFLSIQSLEVGS